MFNWFGKKELTTPIVYVEETLSEELSTFHIKIKDVNNQTHDVISTPYTLDDALVENKISRGWSHNPDFHYIMTYNPIKTTCGFLSLDKVVSYEVKETKKLYNRKVFKELKNGV